MGNSLKFQGKIVNGIMDMDTTKMVCVPHRKYKAVDLCLKSDSSTGMNLIVGEVRGAGWDKF